MNYNSTYYMIVDKEGKVVKESTELEGVRLLTDEDPVYTEGAVMWVNTQNGFVNICALEINIDGEDIIHYDGDFTYYVINGKASVVGYSGQEKDVVIPAKLGEYTVASISPGAFKGSDITSVYFEKAVTSIGENAFDGCQSLTNVFYTGSSDDRNCISIGTGNDALEGAEWSYNYCLHDYVYYEGKDPTCTDVGYEKYGVCSKCGHSTYKEIKALGHDMTEWTETLEPDCTNKGEERKYCTRCNYFEARETDELGHDLIHIDGKEPTYVEPGWKSYEKCTRCNYSTYEVIPAKGQNPFVDVHKTNYYYVPVLWAVDKGITSGTSSTTFSPDDYCTRGQIVTFLWRAAGKQEPSSSYNPFKDVKSTDFFYDAVLWAVEKGITSGTSATTFSPSSPCTRGQTVTFLYRAKGCPDVGIESNPFFDVKTTDYFYNAVLWAVENKITNGTSASTFSPSAKCTRGQIVTFLYRSEENEQQ